MIVGSAYGVFYKSWLAKLFRFSSCVTWPLVSDQLFGKSVLTKDRVKNYTYLLGAANNHVPDYWKIAGVFNEFQVKFAFKVKKKCLNPAWTRVAQGWVWLQRLNSIALCTYLLAHPAP